MPSLTHRNKTLVIVVKNYLKVDIKDIYSCPILLDFFIFSYILFTIVDSNPITKNEKCASPLFSFPTLKEGPRIKLV